MVVSRLKQLMETNGVTLRDLMAKTGLSNETVLRARSEKIVKCRLETLVTIAAALQCKTKDLYDET
ncbi:MAG: hypothetical protein DELT_01893 [Desulfovibrio sp.]